MGLRGVFDEAPTKARIRRLSVNVDFLLGMLFKMDGQYRFRVKGLPPDAQVVYAKLRPGDDRVVTLFIESATFPEVEAPYWNEVDVSIATFGPEELPEVWREDT